MHEFFLTADPQRALRNTTHKYIFAVLAIASLVLLAFKVYRIIQLFIFGYADDIEVFRITGEQVLRHGALYGSLFTEQTGENLLFIYPPFAALLFLPLSFFSMRVDIILWTIITVAVIYWILYAVITRIKPDYSSRIAALYAFLLLGPALSFSEITSHIHFAQVDIFVFALAMADFLKLTPRKIRGVGIGIAAGFKVTPAAYAIIFLARKDWASLARTIGTFLITVIIGFLVNPQQAFYFWTKEFTDTTRAGEYIYWMNQSISGVLASMGVNDQMNNTIMHYVLLFMAIIALWATWKLIRVGQDVLALLFVFLSICLSAPIAVTHHWSGIIIILPIALFYSNRLITAATAPYIAVTVLLSNLDFWGYTFQVPKQIIEPHAVSVIRAECFAGIACYILLLGIVLLIEDKFSFTKWKNQAPML